MCMFKALHKDTKLAAEEHQAITREEFYSFYEVQGMRWKQVKSLLWYHGYSITVSVQI